MKYSSHLLKSFIATAVFFFFGGGVGVRLRFLFKEPIQWFITPINYSKKQQIRLQWTANSALKWVVLEKEVSVQIRLHMVIKFRPYSSLVWDKLSILIGHFTEGEWSPIIGSDNDCWPLLAQEDVVYYSMSLFWKKKNVYRSVWFLFTANVLYACEYSISRTHA